MAALKSQAALVLLLVAAITLGTKTQMAESQSSGGCTSQLTNLNTCAPFVVPGAPNTNPSTDCCGALRAVDQDCLCSTIRIASQLPSQCQLPPLACRNYTNTCRKLGHGADALWRIMLKNNLI
ncbi:hypothetical protein L6164_008321 [Bauhinia variegata]|uniref:Uncharacterized protein n=1 Tax=Bauhinia variegata TaxID=167791 RepID=A0ACB9PGE4_BAUVA|nr:hypothetical protein L6164_008321 [Bauhinia variegata]